MQSAESIRNGTYNKILYYDDHYAFYKIYCNSGDYLIVTLTVDYPTYDLNIDIYDHNYDFQEGSYNTGAIDEVSDIVISKGYYYIRIIIDFGDPPTGDVPFTLVISGSTWSPPASSIPGFEIITLLIGLIPIVGLIYLRIKRKKEINLIF